MKIKINKDLGTNIIYKPHIIAAKLVEAKDEEHILISIEHEGWDLVNNGVENLIKDVCDFLNISYDRISIMSSNLTPNLNFFKHRLFNKNLSIYFMNSSYVNNIDKLKYGLFLARPTNERLYAFYKHITWNHRNKGFSTFHCGDMNIVHLNFCEFAALYNNQWKKIKDVLPYSDFSNSYNPPIVKDSHSNTNFWADIYKNIAVEVVCETCHNNESFFITEKTLRPILYKRLFLVFGSKYYEQKLKKLGIDIFDDVFDKSYDEKENYIRMDNIFYSLNEFLSQNSVKDLAKFHNRLEANKKVVEGLLCKTNFELEKILNR